jgi:adenosylcobinamide-GDP ribazoletransferase
LTSGLRLALTTFTVLPLRTGRVDRSSAALAASLAPAVGLVLGASLAAAGLGLRALGGSPLLAAAAVVALGVLLTRGLHLDGLADTADALGSYRDAERALSIMKKPDVGPFGVAAIMLALLLQTAGAASVLTRPWLAALASVATAVGCGRLAVAWACRRGVPAARSTGLGAAFAGSVGWPALLLGSAAVATVAVAAVPGRAWQGPVCVAAGLSVALLVQRQAVRRFGGITGDVLGACVEASVTAAYLVLALG